MSRPSKNFTVGVLSKWIETNNIDEIEQNMDKIVRSGMLKNEKIRILIRMRRPDDDESDEGNLRDFYGNLLGEE